MEATAQAIGHLVCLWLWTLDNAPDGDLSEMDDFLSLLQRRFSPRRAEKFIKATRRVSWTNTFLVGRVHEPLDSDPRKQPGRARKARERKLEAKGGAKSGAKGTGEEDAPEDARTVRERCAQRSREACWGYQTQPYPARNTAMPQPTKTNITLPNPNHTRRHTTLPHRATIAQRAHLAKGGEAGMV